MEIDWAHMAVTAAVIAVAVYIVNHTSFLGEMSRGKRTVVMLVLLFISLLLVDLFWPWGGG